MTNFKVLEFIPNEKRIEEFFIPGFGIAIVASFPEVSWYTYPRVAATISTLASGFKYFTTSLSALEVRCSNLPANPDCAAPCSNAALQASVYVGPVFKQRLMINGPIVIVKGYHHV